MKYRSNCLIYAIKRFIKDGGYIIFRKSLYGWWWHFFYLKDDGEITEFAPIENKSKRLFPPLLFKGTVRKVDKIDLPNQFKEEIKILKGNKDSMLEKIKIFLDNLNEVHLTGAITIITTIITVLAYLYGDANLQEMSNRGLKLSVFMTYVVSVFKYLGTKKLDVLKEIIEEHNIALGLVLSALIIGGAVCFLL